MSLTSIFFSSTMHLIYKIYEDKERKKKHYIDASSPAKSNWLRYVNCARNVREENVFSFGCDGLVFYMTTKDVEPNTELLTWYGENDGRFLGITRLHPGCYLIQKKSKCNTYIHA